MQSGENDFLRKASEITEANFVNEHFGVSELAREMGMSRSNLHRKVKSATKTSVSQFIRQVRLNQAMELLRQTSSTASEVAYKVGFGSVTYFTKCFHDYYGFPPGEVGKRESGEHNSDDQTDHAANETVKKNRLSISILITGFVVVIAAIVLLFIFKPFYSRNEILEKSIAVLPFINDSPDKENEYFINGIMEEILLNLQTIKELTVISRNSVEKYRSLNKPTIPEISKDLGVNYIVEGSGQKYGNTFVLRVQLIKGSTDKQLWGDSYQREIESIVVIIDVQSEIAESIARELQAVITPEEKQLIERIPTANLVAYEFYQKGYEELRRSGIGPNRRESIEKAEDLFHWALEYDSTFALPYIDLGWGNLHKHQLLSISTETQLDSALILADIALSYDNQEARAYYLKGAYYSKIGKPVQSLESYNKAIELNPNYSHAYQERAWRNLKDNNLVGSIENFHKAVSLDRGTALPTHIRNLSKSYSYAGFKERSNFYNQQALELDGDTVAYYFLLAMNEYWISDNGKKAIEFLERGYAIDSGSTQILASLGSIYLKMGYYEESLKYFKIFIARLKALDLFDPWYIFSIGISFSQNGFKKEAEYYFDEQIKYSDDIIDQGREGVSEQYIRLAMIYAFRGEKEMAYKNLRLYNQATRMNTHHKELRDNLIFESYIDDPEFQQIIRDVESKYQAEHERVRQWLEENDMQ